MNSFTFQILRASETDGIREGLQLPMKIREFLYFTPCAVSHFSGLKTVGSLTIFETLI